MVRETPLGVELEVTRVAQDPELGVRLLVIDDNEIVARSVARLLGVFEMEIGIEHDGRRAIDRLRANERFDLIICDLWMPGCGGDEVLAALRAHHVDPAARPSVIMTSGSDELLDKGRFADVSVLEKPFYPAVLRTLVSTLVNARRGSSYVRLRTQPAKR